MRESAVVLDDLSTGRAELLPAEVPLFKGSVVDVDAVDQVFADHHITGVIHLAALKSVEESVADPLAYYRVNVLGTANVLESMVRHGVRAMVFSSSAAVYGNVGSGLVTEDSPTRPENPYGETKRRR